MTTLSRQISRGVVFGLLAVSTLTIGGLVVPAAAQTEVTFTRDVAPILYENCVSCHRPGELAPMALR